MEDSISTKNRDLVVWVPFFLVFIVFVTCVSILPKTVNWDSARGILAAKQHSTGKSPNILRLVKADPSDLTKERIVPEVWRAPAYQALPYALYSIGLSWPDSLRVIILIFMIPGLASWGYYFNLIVSNKRMVGFLLFITLGYPGIVANVSEYQGGDLLLWAIAPFVITLNLFALQNQNIPQTSSFCSLGGFGATAIFLVKIQRHLYWDWCRHLMALGSLQARSVSDPYRLLVYWGNFRVRSNSNDRLY